MQMISMYGYHLYPKTLEVPLALSCCSNPLASNYNHQTKILHHCSWQIVDAILNSFGNKEISRSWVSFWHFWDVINGPVSSVNTSPDITNLHLKAIHLTPLELYGQQSSKLTTWCVRHVRYMYFLSLSGRAPCAEGNVVKLPPASLIWCKVPHCPAPVLCRLPLHWPSSWHHG